MPHIAAIAETVGGGILFNGSEWITPQYLIDKGIAICHLCGHAQPIEHRQCSYCKESMLVVSQDRSKQQKTLLAQLQAKFGDKWEISLRKYLLDRNIRTSSYMIHKALNYRYPLQAKPVIKEIIKAGNALANE